MGIKEKLFQKLKVSSDELGNKYLEHIKILEDNMITLQGNQIELFELMQKIEKKLK